MKKAAIIFIIIGTVGVILSGISNIFNYDPQYAEFGLTQEMWKTTSLVSCIFSSLLAILFALLGINSLQKDKKSIGIGVCLILFSGLIGGILYLVYFSKSNQETSSKPSQENVHYCPHCGAKIEGDAEFCPMCGKNINENQQQ